jgi:anti-sigma-K factor RskA
MTIDLHSLMAPYALDALEPDERERFEAHLDQCVDCQLELGGFMATAIRLGDAASHTPPPGLRDRLLAEVSVTPQQRPIVTSLSERRGLRHALPRLAVAAAVLVAAVGVGGFLVERDHAQDERRENLAISAVIGADDVQSVAQTFDVGGSVKMYMSAAEDSAVIFAKDLPRPEDGKVYQVWMIDGSGPTSQGTFETDGQMIMEGVAGADRVAVTVEPKGGSDQPTSPPIATITV